MPRKRDLETSACSLSSPETNAVDKRAAISCSDEVVPPISADGEILSEIEYMAPAVLASCRSALERSPAASRAALIKHRASIDPALAKTREILGALPSRWFDLGKFLLYYW